MASGLVTHWVAGADGIKVTVEIPKRANGLHNDQALGDLLRTVHNLPPPDAYPATPVTEERARAAIRDCALMEEAVMTANDPPLPDLGIPLLDAGLLPDDDEVLFPRACPAGGCGEE